jgi:hypothetical protein
MTTPSMTSAPASKAEGDGAPEIEITPAMIEAGATHLYRYHRDRGVDDDTTLEHIYRSMWMARPQREKE